MHLLEDASHTLLGIFFKPLAVQLTFWDSSFLVTLLKFFVCQEILSHYTTYFFEVVKHSKSCILYFFLRRTKATVCTVHVKSQGRRGTAKEQA